MPCGGGLQKATPGTQLSSGGHQRAARHATNSRLAIPGRSNRCTRGGHSFHLNGLD